MRGGIACIAALAVLLLAACGGSGGGATTQLSPAAYRAAIAKVRTEAVKAQTDVGQGLQAKTPDELKQTVDAFATATQRIGDEVAALKPPENAIAPNTELAQGLHDIAAGTLAMAWSRTTTAALPTGVNRSRVDLSLTISIAPIRPTERTSPTKG